MKLADELWSNPTDKTVLSRAVRALEDLENLKLHVKYCCSCKYHEVQLKKILGDDIMNDIIFFRQLTAESVKNILEETLEKLCDI